MQQIGTEAAFKAAFFLILQQGIRHYGANPRSNTGRVRVGEANEFALRQDF
jgi:hypothetical protein